MPEAATPRRHERTRSHPGFTVLILKDHVSTGRADAARNSFRALALAWAALPVDQVCTDERGVNEHLKAVLTRRRRLWMGTDHVELRRWLVDMPAGCSGMGTVASTASPR